MKRPAVLKSTRLLATADPETPSAGADTLTIALAALETARQARAYAAEARGWGDHSAAGYLKVESDSAFLTWLGTKTPDNWDTAYSLAAANVDQNVKLGAAPSFAGMTLTGLTASKVVFTNALGNLSSVGPGTSAQFLKGDGSLDSSAYFILPALTAGSVLFSDGLTISQDNANLFWNNSAKRFGFGTNSLGATRVTIDSFSTNDAALRLRTADNKNIIEFYNSAGGLFGNIRHDGTNMQFNIPYYCDAYWNFNGRTMGFYGNNNANSQVRLYGKTRFTIDPAIDGTSYALAIGDYTAATPLVPLTQSILASWKTQFWNGVNGNGYSQTIIKQQQLSAAYGDARIDIRSLVGAGTHLMSWFTHTGDIGIGTGIAAPSARLHIAKTTDQLRLGYDATNYSTWLVKPVTTIGTDTVETRNVVGVGSPRFSYNKPVRANGFQCASGLPGIDRIITVSPGDVLNMKNGILVEYNPVGDPTEGNDYIE